ncbi:MAG: OprO/OprP family phosphate-selective porin [Proteobacteria bacterium]|nr:OprO/OprP family phosphate-selective porin [Pseudomonadota bacterium]MBU4296086.1 OprO/OprP family phosphate-selective porin [Pseudomonadota bacterium]MCG2748022.1 OprO/OprP family phosphate-selective porin [Desulfobulbaceae bacterium]
MKRSLSTFYILLIGLISLAAIPPCHAFDLGEHLSINGFLSQGYIKSSGNNFLGDSQDGSFQLNEFALTLNSAVTDNLRLGLQLLSRDAGAEGNNDVLIDWAMADYRWHDWLGMRFGKVKLPIGLYNQGRDSDFLRPMVFLPQSIYDENKRTLVVAAVGGSLYGNFSLGRSGDLEYQAYYGRVDFRGDSGQARGMEQLATRIAQMKHLGAVTDIEADNRYVYGGSLVYTPPFDGLRFGVSYFTGQTDFDFDLGAARGDAQGTMKDFVVLSMEYSAQKWTVAAEYTEQTGDREVLGSDIPDGRSQGYYVQLCYHLLDQLGASVLYDVFYADKYDRDGSSFVAQGQPDFLGWRKDLGVGLHWEINSQWLIKAEYHMVDGAALQLPIFNPEGVERDWSYFVLKTSFNF